MTARARLLLDLVLFAVLLVAYNPSWTGLAVHEWLCVAAAVPLLFHLIVNWEWVVQVARRFGERLRAMPRVHLVVDTGLFVAAVSVMVSGLMVSQAIARALGLVIVPDSAWVLVHSWSADATIALLLIHFVLHWRWVVSTARRLSGPRSRAETPTISWAPPQSSPAHASPRPAASYTLPAPAFVPAPAYAPELVPTQPPTRP
jgi:hypothetical protein